MARIEPAYTERCFPREQVPRGYPASWR